MLHEMQQQPQTPVDARCTDHDAAAIADMVIAYHANVRDHRGGVGITLLKHTSPYAYLSSKTASPDRWFRASPCEVVTRLLTAYGATMGGGAAATAAIESAPVQAFLRGLEDVQGDDVCDVMAVLLQVIRDAMLVVGTHEASGCPGEGRWRVGDDMRAVIASALSEAHRLITEFVDFTYRAHPTSTCDDFDVNCHDIIDGIESWTMGGTILGLDDG